jgi:predicted alpha/beta hydrolase family esterase
MKKKVLLLHGWGGSDYPHWQSWLAGELAKDYGKVSFLKFSNFDTPKLDVWMSQLQAELKDFQPDIVICHSLANTLWFHLCNTTKVQSVARLLLVAPPSLTCTTQEIQEFFPLQAPKNLHAKEVLLITSTNDPYLTQKEAQELQQTLNVKMEIIKDGGHINAESGYKEWSWIKEQLSKRLS